MMWSNHIGITVAIHFLTLRIETGRTRDAPQSSQSLVRAVRTAYEEVTFRTSRKAIGSVSGRRCARGSRLTAGEYLDLRGRGREEVGLSREVNE